MKRIISASVIAFAAFASVPAFSQILLTDFESYTTPTADGTVLFRSPSFSGSTSGKLDTTIYNTTIVESTGVPAGNANAGLNTLHTSFDFKDTGATPLWLRLTSNGAGSLPNPTIGLWGGWGIKFDVYSDTALYLTTLVRETESNAALGANGGASGSIEFVGGNPGAATGKGKSVAANTWTTLEFRWTDPVAGFTGDGVLNPGVDNKGVLEALGIATDDANVGPINVWIDNIQLVPEPSTLALALLGGLAFLVRKVRRQ